MTAEDLVDAHIAQEEVVASITDPKTKEKKNICEYRIDKVEQGMLFLVYNRFYISKSEEEKKISFDKNMKSIFANFDFSDKREENEEIFLRKCLAIGEQDLSLAFFRGKTDVDKVVAVHDIVCKKMASSLEDKKENIREARKIDEMENSFDKDKKIYIECKEGYEYMLKCTIDEGKFESLYNKLEGRISKDEIKKKIKADFNREDGIQANFIKQQSSFFGKFAKLKILSDVRLLNPANERLVV